MLDKIKNNIKESNILLAELSALIGYSNIFTTPLEHLVDTEFLKDKWSIEQDKLIIHIDYHTYDGEINHKKKIVKIDSVFMEGKQFFIGEKDNLTYVLTSIGIIGEPTQTIFVLDNNNKI